MTNGLVNPSPNGLENQFGTPLAFWRSLTIFIEYSFPTANLGLNKTAYVPPHLRNQQRAASSPTTPNK